jgi:tetratricopeptide (TPR) repeat protein
MLGGTRTRSRLFSTFVALALASQSLPALAQDSPDELARRHFESGVAYLQEADYESALKAFEKAYELSKRPDLLLNVATVHERKGELASAVASLKKYLEVAPDGEQRATVESRIANLEKRMAEQPKGTPTGPGEGPMNPPPPGGPGTAPVPPDRPAPVQTQSNVPAFVLLGIGGITAAGAVITGVLANGEYSDAKDTCSPSCTDDDVSAGKTLALTSTILTGVAVVSASVGAVLYFTAKPATQEKAKRPRRFDLGLGVAPGGAAAAARWRF